MFYPISYRYCFIDVLIDRVDVWKALLNVNEEVLKMQGLFNTKSIVAEFFNQAVVNNDNDNDNDNDVSDYSVIIMIGNANIYSIPFQSIPTLRDFIVYIFISQAH